IATPPANVVWHASIEGRVVVEKGKSILIVDTHPPALPAKREGSESPSVVSGQAIECMACPPTLSVWRGALASRPSPAGGLAASLDASATTQTACRFSARRQPHAGHPRPACVRTPASACPSP